VKKKIRFPRLETSHRDLARIESLLRVTYNKLAKDRAFSKKTYAYDIYRTKRADDAKRNFILLADTLFKEKVDPSLYLKILAKYGKFGNKGLMPPFGWLSSRKALGVFRWMLVSQGKMFHKKSEFRFHLNDSEKENSRRIGRSIRRSKDFVQEAMKTWDLDLETAVFWEIDRLSPWFLAVCVPFFKNGGPELFEGDSKIVLQKCIKHLVRDKHSFAEAMEAYGKF